jgi:hypothetical protein
VEHCNCCQQQLHGGPWLASWLVATLCNSKCRVASQRQLGMAGYTCRLSPLSAGNTKALFAFLWECATYLIVYTVNNLAHSSLVQTLLAGTNVLAVDCTGSAPMVVMAAVNKARNRLQPRECAPSSYSTALHKRKSSRGKVRTTSSLPCAHLHRYRPSAGDCDGLRQLQSISDNSTSACQTPGPHQQLQDGYTTQTALTSQCCPRFPAAPSTEIA